MDPSDSHQPFDLTTITNTHVPEAVTAQNIPPLNALTLNELNRVEAHVEPQVEPMVQPQVEPVVQPQVEPHAASETALVSAQPSSNRRPYTNMIYDAVVALNEPEGSSKWAISRYIKRSNPDLPDGHEGLLTHHLEVMHNCGILAKVKKAYKLSYFSPPENVAVAAAAVDAGPVVASGSEIPPTYTGSLDLVAVSAPAVDTGLVVASGSEIPPTYTGSLDMVAVTPSGSASQPQKRGRGRPPKDKTEAPQQQQPIDAQPISQVLQPSINVEPSAVQPSGEQPELPVTNPSPVDAESVNRRSGRPRKDGPGSSVSTANLAVTMKRRGWPTSFRPLGRERKPISVTTPDSALPGVANDAGRSERPMTGGSGGVATLAQADVEAMAVAAVMKRGRGRPPKRGRGRTAGRPIQDTPRPVTRATGIIQEPAYGELKGTLDVASEIVKGILNMWDNQAVTQSGKEVEGVAKMLTAAQQAIEEAQPEEAAPLIEGETKGSEGGEEQPQIHILRPETLIVNLQQPQLQPETLPLIQTMTLIQPEPQTMTQPEPQILHELEPLPELEPLTLTQPPPQILPPLPPNTEEAEAMDEDMF